MAKPTEHWRSSTTRLILIYGAFFVLWSIALIGAIQWETTRYLSNVVDQILVQRAHYLATIDRDRLPEAMAATAALDLRDVMSFGLFAADGGYVAGNIERSPPGLEPDGRVHLLPAGVQRRGQDGSVRARGLALRLPTGELLVLARATSVIDQVSAILRRVLLWALTLTVIPGLLGGWALSRGPLRRVRRIEAATQPIMRGDLHQRLPLSGRRDELDMLASVVNTMLGEIERLMGEVKGVCDNIAHDLRTPLTRLRAQLHRLQQQGVAQAGPQTATIERCIVDVDAVLERFRALLRISELEDLHRRAGFASIDLAAILHQVHELYVPLAEDKPVALAIELGALPAIHADPHLLFEAFSNLVANAIKFTPPGGTVTIRASAEHAGARVDILDSGPGIPPAERDAVVQRFYRGDSGREAPGFGLGLSIVAAIVRLHGFRFEIGDCGSGARVTIYCRANIAVADAG